MYFLLFSDYVPELMCKGEQITELVESMCSKHLAIHADNCLTSALDFLVNQNEFDCKSSFIFSC